MRNIFMQDIGGAYVTYYVEYDGVAYKVMQEKKPGGKIYNFRHDSLTNDWISFFDEKFAKKFLAHVNRVISSKKGLIAIEDFEMYLS